MNFLLLRELFCPVVHASHVFVTIRDIFQTTYFCNTFLSMHSSDQKCFQLVSSFASFFATSIFANLSTFTTVFSMHLNIGKSSSFYGFIGIGVILITCKKDKNLDSVQT